MQKLKHPYAIKMTNMEVVQMFIENKAKAIESTVNLYKFEEDVEAKKRYLDNRVRFLFDLFSQRVNEGNLRIELEIGKTLPELEFVNLLKESGKNYFKFAAERSMNNGEVLYIRDKLAELCGDKIAVKLVTTQIIESKLQYVKLNALQQLITSDDTGILPVTYDVYSVSFE